MARIVYALSGQGRGHASRGIAISKALREHGHDVLFCCGGTAREILESQEERVIGVPALRQMMDGNEVQVVQTLRYNWRHLLHVPDITSRLAETFSSYGADLLITDFEAFAPRAARRIGLPVLSFNHQQVITETRYQLPRSCWFHAGLAYATVKLIAPSHPKHVLLTSFFFPPVKHPSRTTMVPPIIRPAVQEATPSSRDHVLVYYNQPEGAEYVLDVLRQVDTSFIVYNFTPPAPADRYANIEFKKPSVEGFLDDLASSRAVICTAGFTLISEALFLGKPLLVVPNRGIFEQTLNALFLQREGLGEAVIDEPLTRERVDGFLTQIPAYEARLRDRPACGNKKAIACIERVLDTVAPPTHPRPALPHEQPVLNKTFTDAVAHPE